MPFLSKYGVARHIYISMVKRGVVDHAVSADWTPSAGDVKISKDGGAAANVTNLPAAIAMGNSTIWDFSITATEMQAAQVMVTIGDSATKAVEDSMFVIETYGNASGQFQIDFADSVRAGLTALPNAAVSGVGGLLTAPTTANVGLADLSRILGTALTETAGQIAAGFKKLFDVASPVFTLLSVVQTGDSYPRIGAPAGASVSADVAAVKTDTAAVKVQTDKLTFTVANQVDSNVKSNAGTAITAAAGIQEVKVASIAANAITATSINADAITAAKIADGAIDAATFAAGAINAAAIAADAIGASELAADAAAEIAAAVRTELTTELGRVDVAVSTRLASASYTAPLDAAGVRSAVGLASANLDTQLTAIDDYVDTEVAAIKAKTDQLTFTVAGQVDSNIQYVNDVQVNGVGTAGSPWGP